MSTPSREIDRLRRCLRDLVAVSSMSVVWMDREPRQIGQELVNVLLRTLQLDFIFLRLNGRNKENFIEIVRTSEANNNSISANAIGQKLSVWLTSDSAGLPANPCLEEAGSVQLAVTSIGYDGKCGMLVAGSGKPDFPTEEDRLLLNVGANQVAVILQHLWAEDVLRECEQTRRQMAAIVESSEDAIFGSTLDGIIESWNLGAEKLYGYTAEEVRGKSVGILFPPELLDKISEIKEKIGRGESIRAYETVRIRKDGKPVNVSTSISPINDENKVVVGVSAITRDISDRNRAERRRLARLRVIEALAQASTIKETSSHILQTICENLEWDFGALWNVDLDAQLMRCVEFWHNPSLRAEDLVADIKQRTFVRGDGYPGRVWISRKPIWIKNIALEARSHRVPIGVALGLQTAFFSPILLGEQFLGIIELFSREIKVPDADLLEMMASIGNQIGQFMERKQAEQEVLRLLAYEQQQKIRQHRVAEVSLKINSALSVEEVLRIITEEAREIIGAHQSVSSTTSNREWAQMISAVSLSDKYAKWRTYDAKPDGNGIYAMVCETNRPMRLTQAELEAHLRWRNFSGQSDKHPPMMGWLAVPFIGSKGQNLGLIQLSHKYEGEFTQEDEDVLFQLAHMGAFVIENSHLYEELLQADRAKDEFLALVSHEIRNPLTAILGWVQLIRKNRTDEALLSRALDIIESNTQTQVKLIEDLLDVSRILSGKLKIDRGPTELVLIAQESVDAARPAAEAKSINLQSKIDFSTGIIIGDPDRLQQIVMNLLSNAIKFTPEGGSVELRLERIKEPVGRSWAQLIVSDTGVGISAEFLPNVFGRFHQDHSSSTKREGGLGLGLALVRHLVELHGGTVRAESEGKNRGSRFTVTFPLVEKSQPFVSRNAFKTNLG